MEEMSVSLKLTKDPAAWTQLAKLTMCRLIMFNKRRRAEVKDLKVADYLSRPDWTDHQNGEFDLALSASSRMLAKRMDMVISAGKSRKNVDAYVLLPPDAKTAVELLIEFRATVGIRKTNPYIFARMRSDTPFTGNTEMRELANSCPGINHPDRITSNHLRKYIATVSHILDMTDNETEMLATHLGHDPKTHKENYRLTHSTRELSLVSHLLLPVESGAVNKWQGKKLSEVPIEELPDMDQFLEESDDDAVEERGPDPIESQTEEAVECPYPIKTVTSEAVTSHTETSFGNITEPAASSEKRGKKVPWSRSTEKFLKKAFRSYLTRSDASVHNTDIIMAQNTCAELSGRTLAQIRSKLNNMKLGKSK